MSRPILDLAIVTSCHNYGRYLEDWARSIVEQTGYLPKVCVIVDNGSTDFSPRLIKNARQILEKAGISCRTERMTYANFGAGRNRAVSLSGDTEWVMHLDADDTLMPHCLEDTAALMPSADVVGFGYQRSGNLASGPANRTRIYSAHRGESTLRSKAPCSGVSPFRRKFWEISPYREDMRGGWDTALWIGFAHLNARFVPTKRPVFYYRQHADSIFNTRRLDHRAGRLVGSKLGSLRRKITDGVSIVVPILPDGGARDASWRWIKKRYQSLHPRWEIVEGRLSPGQLWCKGEAVAAGVEKSRHHTLIIADSDCFINPRALTEAVAQLREEDVGWVVPHTLVHRIDKQTSDSLMERDPVRSISGQDISYTRKPYEGFAGGGIVVVDRSDYQAIGGIPSAFKGWGAEDECLAIILDTILEPHVRLEYDLWHMWHPTARGANVHNNRRNRNLLRVFRSYAGDPSSMWDLILHVSQGADPLTHPPLGHRLDMVLMVAMEKHQRGSDVVNVGEIFRATEEEARRYASRPRRIARPANGSLLQVGSAQRSSGSRRKKVTQPHNRSRR